MHGGRLERKTGVVKKSPMCILILTECRQVPICNLNPMNYFLKSFQEMDTQSRFFLDTIHLLFFVQPETNGSFSVNTAGFQVLL